MNVLILKPGQQKLAFSYFSSGWDKPVFTGLLADYRSDAGSQHALAHITQQILTAPQTNKACLPLQVIALRGVYGGEEFKAPTQVTPEVIQRLEKLVPLAPLHTPPLLALIHACGVAFPNVPVLLIFETAFFVNLPAREYLYAVDKNLSRTPGLRRFGYHGICHANACAHIMRKRSAMGLTKPARILSICLDARPEVAAVLGHKPLMITSGATPLEGLPGQTSCGELDPSIVIMLAQKKNWGPEQINAVLTQQSGWMGLTGRIASLAEIFSSGKPECQLAKEILQYRLLHVCGAGMAALGGVDAVVFSGRCSGVGVDLGLWLKQRLDFQHQGNKNSITIEICADSLDRVLVDTACAAVRLR
ncbi:MAG: hypothetical protein NTY01_25410 [Verrucomicrobia bacterium]|nr:hypothetical protein [Verrucomicrobiota bacterium]